MKLNKKRIVIFSVIIVIFILLLPILYKDRTYTPLVGPSLSEIEYTEISFNNGNLKLAGMMILPEGEGPFPVAVIIHGSGTSKRDNKWYLTVAKHLQENGIAVLLPDKRGSEKSKNTNSFNRWWRFNAECRELYRTTYGTRLVSRSPLSTLPHGSSLVA